MSTTYATLSAATDSIESALHPHPDHVISNHPPDVETGDSMIQIIHSDNVQALDEMSATLTGRVHLAYLDPPFATGKTQVGAAGSYSDTSSLKAWMASAYATVEAIKPLLHETGSIVLHCDWRTNCLARSLLDRLFGFESFASEIIWSYRRWPTKTRNFQRTHDTLLRYVKTPGRHTWNQLYQPLSASTLKTFGQQSQKAETAGGKRVRSTRLSHASPGAAMGDVWELPILAPMSKERTGYPTQKPEALLERIILATTNPGDMVIDPYCGSGVTLAVAKRLGRDAIGIDRNIEAIEVTRRRVA